MPPAGGSRGCEGMGSSEGEERMACSLTRPADLPYLPTEVWALIASGLQGTHLLAFASASRQLRSAQARSGRILRTRHREVFSKTKRPTEDFLLWLGECTDPADERAFGAIACAAARHGYLRVLECVESRARGVLVREETSWHASRAGQLDALAWLRDRGCHWSEHTATAAASGGHLSVLRWLESQGCPMLRHVCREVARSNDAIVLWLDASPA